MSETAIVAADRMVPAADGVPLATDVYLPDGTGPWPVVVVRTPYDRRRLIDEGNYWRHRGVAFVAQDVRGRYGSGGDWRPYQHERADGASLVEWLTVQSWAGDIALKGASYEAHTALVTAVNGHPSIRTVISAVPALDHHRVAYTGTGLLHLSGRAWWNAVHASGRVSDEQAERRLLARQSELLSSLPVADLWRRLGIRRRQWLADIEAPDDSAAVSVDLPEVPVPVLHIGGWFDPFVSASAESWQTCGSRRRPRPSRLLVLGPWGHDLTPRGRVGERMVGRDGALDLGRLQLSWVRRWCDRDRSVPAGAGTSRAWFFVLGDRWRHANTWPPPGTELDLFLTDGCLSTTPPGQDSLVTFRSDPCDPVPSRLAPVDQRAVHARGDVLTYTSAPAKVPLTIVGEPVAHLVVATDGRDLDVFAQLAEVLPDGRAVHVCHGALRARHRAGWPAAELLEPGRPYHLSVKLAPVALRIPAGHRIRLAISATCFPYYSRNPQTSESPLHAATLGVAVQTVFHGSAEPSRLVLPLWSDQEDR